MLNVGALHEGFGLDHIKAGKAMTIYHDLKLDKLDCTVAIIKNARSNKMGVKDIKVTDVVKIGENYYIKGENFTEFSKVSLDGKILKTVYLGPTILALKEDVDPEDASRMKVSQVEKNKEILSTTE